MGRRTYLLYLDESGTHGGSPVFILSGLAVHEADAWFLQNRLRSVVAQAVPNGFDPDDFELHASEIKSPVRGSGTPSIWANVSYGDRMALLQSVYRSLKTYNPRHAEFPVTLFGAVVQRSYSDHEHRAYEEVLKKFDDMLWRYSRDGERQTGIVIHDRRTIERDVQQATHNLRYVEGRLGLLSHLADVPFFADSRASRLIQASDFVSWALWRYYGLQAPDPQWVDTMWDRFDCQGAVMHGLIHVSPRFRGGCTCPPCASRQ